MARFGVMPTRQNENVEIADVVHRDLLASFCVADGLYHAQSI